MVRPLILATLLSCLTAAAQTPPRYYCEAADWFCQHAPVSCSGGTCTRAAPTAADFAGSDTAQPVGMTLSGARGFYVTACAASEQTLSGAGTLDAYVYEPWTGLVLRNAALDLKLSDAVSSTACAGAACRCATWPDMLPALRLNRRVLYAPSGVTVSGGSTLSVYLNGEVTP